MTDVMTTLATESGGRGTARRRAVTIVVILAVLATAVVAAREVSGAAVAFQEDSLALDPGEIRTLQARTPVGAPLRGALSWSVEPSWLGQMDERGGFHAGDVTGSGTVTARFGLSSAQVAVTVTCPKSAQIQGIRFEVTCGPAADVYVDVAAQGGAQRAGAEVEREAARVSRDLQIVSDRRFRVYYLGSEQALVAAVSWLGRGFSSGPTVQESEAVYLDSPDIIAIDQSQARGRDTQLTVRHELVHRFIRHVVGVANINDVPTWLNEGLAFLEESDAGWRLAEARIVSASSAYLDRLPTLASLSGQGDWNRRTDLEAFYQYYVASTATEFLIDDVTLPALVRALRFVGGGESFPTAMARAAPGFDYNAFARRFSDRAKALIPTYPGIIAMPGSPDGVGSTVLAYGLRPGASATVTATGPTERKFAGNVDMYGIYVKYLAADWPTGQYRVTVETEGRRFEVTATR
jgi:hypothetical protein